MHYDCLFLLHLTPGDLVLFFDGYVGVFLRSYKYQSKISNYNIEFYDMLIDGTIKSCTRAPLATIISSVKNLHH